MLDLAGSGDDHEPVVFSEYHAMGAPSAAHLVRTDRPEPRAHVGRQPELLRPGADPEDTVDLPMDPDTREALEDLTVELHRIVDPHEVRRPAGRHRAAVIERSGGTGAAAPEGARTDTPAPDGTAGGVTA